MRFCVVCILAPLLVVVHCKPLWVGDALARRGIDLSKRYAVEPISIAEAIPGRPRRRIDRVKRVLVQKCQPRKAEPVNLAFSRRRVREHMLERDVLGGLDLLDDDTADGDIAVLFASLKEIFIASSLVPDRNAPPIRETFELVPQSEHHRIADDRVNVELEEFFDSVAVDEIGISPQIIIPIAMV